MGVTRWDSKSERPVLAHRISEPSSLEEGTIPLDRAAFGHQNGKCAILISSFCPGIWFHCAKAKALRAGESPNSSEEPGNLRHSHLKFFTNRPPTRAPHLEVISKTIYVFELIAWKATLKVQGPLHLVEVKVPQVTSSCP